MPWHAQLNLDYRLDAQRTVLRHEHSGPLRIFKSLYPEGDGICHNVIIHPPGGLVGGDVLDVQVHVGRGAHGLISTPGATRWMPVICGTSPSCIWNSICTFSTGSGCCTSLLSCWAQLASTESITKR